MRKRYSNIKQFHNHFVRLNRVIKALLQCLIEDGRDVADLKPSLYFLIFSSLDNAMYFE